MKETAFRLRKRRSDVAIAVDELLHRAAGRLMDLGEMLFQPKARPEFAVESVWFITDNVQSAACAGAFRAERRNDDAATWL